MLVLPPARLGALGPPSGRAIETRTSCASRRWVHFVGIGGSGLSALALLALKQGWKVSGSDAAPLSDRLESEGALVFAGHSAAHVKDSVGRTPDAIVVTSAIRGENEEVAAARSLGVPVLKRADWLGKITEGYDLIAVAGSHGKSTTTAMLAVALQRLGEDATAIVGADVEQFPGGGNALVGGSRFFVLEADEYDGCFLGVSPSIAIVTNVDWEHVDMFPNEESVRDMFRLFLKKIRPEGSLVIYGDSAATQFLLSTFVEESAGAREAVTYGLNEENQWRAIMLAPNVEGGTDYVAVRNGRPMAKVSLKIPGIHNVLNSLAAIVTVGLLASRRKPPSDATAQLKAKAGEATQAASKALAGFTGVRRRFEFVGRVLQCHIYDDYAHHPTEVRAVMQAARQRFGGEAIWVVFQPHTYSRLALLLQDFAVALSGADRVIVTEVYSAREDNVWKISGSDLVSAITGPPALFVPTLDEVVARLSWELATMDESGNVNKSRGNIILLTLGAGDVTTIGPKLIDALRQQTAS